MLTPADIASMFAEHRAGCTSLDELQGLITHRCSASPTETQAARDDTAILSRLVAVLEAGHAYNGISDDNARIYAEVLRRILATHQFSEPVAIAKEVQHAKCSKVYDPGDPGNWRDGDDAMGNMESTE